jgi:glycosyltransferase involved in cell wall biosynthesis
MSLVRHGETGFLVEAHDWRGIASMLLQFSSNLELKYKMRRKGLEYARRFSVQEMVESHIEVYQKLAHRCVVNRRTHP